MLSMPRSYRAYLPSCTCLNRRHATGWLALALLGPHAAPAQTGRADAPRPTALPSLGDAGEMTPLQERKLGDRIARELFRDPAYFDDPVIAEWVDSLWRPLRAAARQRGELPAELDERYAWRVLLGRGGDINAFALPGGYFGLYLGLVGVVDTRDELASVLAHEMAHVTQRHIARMVGQQSRQAPLLLATMVLGALAASRNPQAGTALAVGGQAAALQQQLGYSRNMEREADRIGYGIFTQAGFAPRGAAGMFEKLQHASRLSDRGDWPYLRSHPLTTERLAEARRRAPHAAQPAAPDLAQAQVSARARVLARPGVDVLRAWAAAPQDASQASQPPARRVAALYAAALARAELRDLPGAQALAEPLAALTAASPAAARQTRLLQADLALRAGQHARVQALLKNTQPPGPEGRPERLLLAQADAGAGQPEAATGRLQPWVSDHPLDATAWQLLATAWRARQHTLRALRAEGEAHYALMDLAGAADRFRAAQEAARRDPGADHIEASIIDTRLRETQHALRQQQRDDEQAAPR